MAATLTPWHEEVGRRIREHRQERGWRRLDLVIAIHETYGYGPSTDVIEQLERGRKRFVDVPTVQRIAEALEVDLAQLVPDVKDYADLADPSETVRYLFPGELTPSLEAAA